GDQHAQTQADQRGHQGNDHRLDQDRPHHLAAAGPQAAQQGQLAGALGDDDGEGVEDQEPADQQGHEGEGQQRGGQEAPEGVVDGGGRVLSQLLAGEHLVPGVDGGPDPVAQLLGGDALLRGGVDLVEPAIAVHHLPGGGAVEGDEGGR